MAGGTLYNIDDGLEDDNVATIAVKISQPVDQIPSGTASLLASTGAIKILCPDI